jgi:hypothetical protein
MTAAALSSIAAQEHINDLMRDADCRRRATEARSPRRVRLSIPRWTTGRAARTATA